MNVNQASTGLDKILTKSSQGYGHAPENMWPHLFPYVAIPDRLNNKVLVFDDSMFVMADPNAHQRAPGTHIKGITFTYSDTPISYKQYALAAVIPQEILEAANEGPKLNLKLHHIHLLQDYFDLRKEVQCATLARSTASYVDGNSVTLSDTGQWSHAESSPLTAVDDAKEVIRAKIGRDPNIFNTPAKVYKWLKRHPKIMAHYARGQSGADVPITKPMLEEYFEIKMAVPKSVSKLKKGAPFVDIWGNDAGLYYVPGKITTEAVPSFGYMYGHQGYPLVRPYRFDEDTLSWKAAYIDECQPYVTGMGAGYLFKDAVS